MDIDTTTRHVESDQSQLVVFSLANEEYALPITQIKEVIRYTRPRPVLTDSAWISGVISLRGKIVEVGDIGARLGVHGDRGDTAKIVIVETHAGTVGIVVDEVDQVLTIDHTAIDTSTVTNRELVHGIAKIEDRLVVLLDAEPLLQALPTAA